MALSLLALEVLLGVLETPQCNLSTWIQSRPLYTEKEASLGYLRLSQKQKRY